MPHPDSPTNAIKSLFFIDKLRFFKIVLSSLKQKLTLFNVKSIGSSFSRHKDLFSFSFKSKNLNILSLAVIPVNATWKNESNLLKGKKNSAESKIIVIAPPNEITPLLYFERAINIPTAAPPYVIISIILIEFN